MCSTPKNAGLANHARRVQQTSIDYTLLKRASDLADQQERERKQKHNPDASQIATPVVKRRLRATTRNKHGMARLLEWLRPFYT